MTPDTVYVERANARWEAWTYSDGQRVMVARHYGSLSTVLANLRAEGYNPVVVTA